MAPIGDGGGGGFSRYRSGDPLDRLLGHRALGERSQGARGWNRSGSISGRGADRAAGLAELDGEEPPVVQTTPAHEAAPTPERHFVEFTFVYPDGKPVEGLEYRLRPPSEAETEGRLTADGRIRRDDVEEGKWTVAVKGVDLALWEKGRIRCDESIRLYGRVSGFADGTSAKVKVFREYAEKEADCIDTLEGEVRRGEVEVSWKYDYLASDERKAEQGVVRFVAALEVDGGRHWTKTRVPLSVELPTIQTARWAGAPPRFGEAARMTIETAGFRDGADASFEIWRTDGESDPSKVDTIEGLKVVGGKLEASWARHHESDADNPAPPAADSFDHFFRIRVQTDVARTADSDVLWWQA